jgi:hypothetical protein
VRAVEEPPNVSFFRSSVSTWAAMMRTIASSRATASSFGSSEMIENEANPPSRSRM